MAVFEPQPASPEPPLPLLHVRRLLAQLEDQHVQLALQHVDLALRELLLPASEQQFLGFLLQGSSAQLFFSGTQLLQSQAQTEINASFLYGCQSPSPKMA